MCKGCITNIKSICGNKDSETDTLIAAAIRIGRKVNRTSAVRQAVTRLCKPCKSLKETCQQLRKANRALKDQNRKYQRSQEAKKRNGFKSKTTN